MVGLIFTIPTVSAFVVYCLAFVCPSLSAVNVELTEAENRSHAEHCASVGLFHNLLTHLTGETLIWRSGSNQ